MLEAREALGASATEFPFSSYGEQRDNSPNRDPQVSYLVPVGTPVYAPVSGRVIVVGELYSGDFGIQIGAADQTQLVPVWEVEHMVDVLVEEGDLVVAGQRVGTAKDAETVHMDYFTVFNGNIGFHGIPWVGSRDDRLWTPLGQYGVSHGCIRMSNAGITTLSKILPLGTPVIVKA